MTGRLQILCALGALLIASAVPGLQGSARANDFPIADKVVVEKSKNVRIIKTDDAAGVTIISSSAIDDETRAKLEAVLKEAGKDGEVVFIDGSELTGDARAHSEHDVRIIKKKVEKTN